MKVSPSLLPLLRSPLQGELLALLLLHPEREYAITELANDFGASPSTVLREIGRLTEAGILADRKVGRNRLVTARTDTPLYRPLSDLMSVTFGPVPVLAEALAGLAGVRQAFIYGSWAARYNGEPGPPPADVDVLVVGDPDADELFDLAEEASRRLRREVNTHRLSPEAWASPSADPFLTSVRERPLIPLDLNRETP
ncbi:ArsR family transcriptional regulator [Streptomyces sp. NBC_00239]|uniref:ArsR family transcriptional regulator n=1 Tax=Streptomyces sp. NBC_00239 TaxID=2903640 RepID=UPI002E2BA671|nr:ArsR family transcriptional regulator [Streptomyces sp. NBC_00239]